MTREQMETHLSILGWTFFVMPESAGMARFWVQAPSGQVWFWWLTQWYKSSWLMLGLRGMGYVELPMSVLGDAEFMALTRLVEKAA